jgi:hypothetical protein
MMPDSVDYDASEMKAALQTARSRLDEFFESAGGEWCPCQIAETCHTL